MDTNIQTYIAFLKIEKLNYFKIIFQDYIISIGKGCKHNSRVLDSIFANLTPNLPVRISLPKDLQEKAKIKKVKMCSNVKTKRNCWSTLNSANVSWRHKTYKPMQLLHYSNTHTFLFPIAYEWIFITETHVVKKTTLAPLFLIPSL